MTQASHPRVLIVEDEPNIRELVCLHLGLEGYSCEGVGDAVAEAVADAGFTVHRLAVREIPRSGKPEELLERFGISAAHIIDAVRAVRPDLVGQTARPSA